MVNPNKRPTGLNGHLSIRLYTDFLSEGFIFVYQHPHHRINENQRWYRKAASKCLNTIAINVLYIVKVKILHIHYNDRLNILPRLNIRIPAPGVMNITILVDPSLVINTIFIVCLIYNWEQRRKYDFSLGKRSVRPLYFLASVRSPMVRSPVNMFRTWIRSPTIMFAYHTYNQ